MIQEVLGYRASINDARAKHNMEAVMPLTGCDDFECSLQDLSVSHIALEAWLESYGVEYERFKDRRPDLAPEDLGSMGYAGEEAMFVSPHLVEHAYEDAGISLGWYRSYNSSKVSVRKYFSSLEDLPIEDFAFCNDSTVMWADPHFINDYARWSGDLEGLEQVPHGYRARCQAFDRFWIAPACRHGTLNYVPCRSKSTRVDSFN